jgi:hypothetical protein
MRRPLAWSWVCAVLLTPPARAAVPAVEYFFPGGGRQGTTVTISAGTKADAKFEPWPAKAWSDCPGLEITPGDENGTFRVKIPPDAPPGPHLVRVYNDEGASVPRVFFVGRHRSDLEKEPNDSFATAQTVEELPAVVDGRLEKTGDADSYAIQAEAGRWIVAELECRRLNSPADPALHLLGPDGTEVAFNHDTFGLDPLIAFRAPRTGRYVLQVVGFAHPPAADVRFAGSKATVYRLSVTTGPYARCAFPACAPRGKATTLRLRGWNFPSPEADAMSLEFDPAAALRRDGEAILAPPTLHNLLRVPLFDADLTPVAEAAGSGDAPQPVEAPAAVAGRIDPAGDVDRFAFAAKRGERFNLAVMSASIGFPLDGVLTVEGPDGKQLARADDERGIDFAARDARLEWAAPADGTYVATLSDLNGFGGPGYVYHLQIERPRPDFTATTEAHSLKLDPGKSAEVRVAVARQNGHAAALSVLVTGLPEGVTSTTAEVPAKGGAVSVTLSAAASAKPGGSPIRVSVVSPDEDRPVVKHATFALGEGQPVQRADAVWLTVGKPGPTTAPAAEKK